MLPDQISGALGHAQVGPVRLQASLFRIVERAG